MCSAKASLTVTTRVAPAYRQRSSRSVMRITRASVSSPTRTATSGQRSRTSKTHGTRCRAAINAPTAPTESGGELARITSGRPSAAPTAAAIAA